jgi:NADH-quinone oxidoreductase subunit N
MSLLAFLIACGAGSTLGIAGRAAGRAGNLAGLAGLVAAMLAALFIGSTTRLSVADVTLAGSEYSGRFLACAAGSGLVLSLVGLALGWPDRLAPAALAAFAGLAVAITAVDAAVALAAGAAATTAGALVLAHETGGSAPAGRLAEMRTIGLVAAVCLGASIAMSHPAWTGGADSGAVVLAFCGLGLALAVRSGAVPFHVPAVKLSSNAGPLAPALLLVWIPAGLGIVAISWSATTFGVRSDWLNAAGTAVQIVAVATIVLGGLAALVHDELEEIAAYSIVADAGFVLLALAARSDSATEPARMWLLAFIVAKVGLVVWAAVVAHTRGSSNLGRLRGWLRRAPLLGLALLAIVVATLGWPGSAVFEARSTLVRLALPDGLRFVFVVSILLSLAWAGRLLVVGLLSPIPDAVAVPSAPDTEAAIAAPPPPTPRRRRGSAAATAATQISTPTATVEFLEAASAATPEATPGLRSRLMTVWRSSRTLEASAVLVVGAAAAVALSFGGLGVGDASQYGIPLDTAAHATPTPLPPPTLAVTPTPVPTLAPHITALPSTTPGASGSVKPSTSPAPVKTTVPVHPPAN